MSADDGLLDCRPTCVICGQPLGYPRPHIDACSEPCFRRLLARPPDPEPPGLPLTALGMQIRDHWQKYLPKMSAELKRRGQFHRAVYEAQELVGETLYRLEMKEKLPHDRAWDVARHLAFFRSEQDRPEHPNRLWASLRTWLRLRLSVEKRVLRLQRGELPPRQNPSSPNGRPPSPPPPNHRS